MRRIQHLTIGLLVMVSLIACKKDEIDINPPPGTPAPVSVKFEEDASVSENAGATEVMLLFDKAAFREGHLTVEVSTDFPEAFQTVPAVVNGFIEIPVAKGKVSVSFTVTPANNELLDENRIITFELSGVSEGFTIGTKSDLRFTILDDEAPVSASFSESSGALPENEQNGFNIDILLSAPAPEAGKVIIQINEMPEESFFHTDPPFNANGRLEITIPKGATSASFKLIPTDNALIKGDQKVLFSITDTEGAIVKGTQLSFELTILDDELFSKAKSYETAGGGWRSKKTYEYDENGRVHKVHWETETPFLRKGTETFYYAENGLIEHINRYEGRDEYFYQENGRIVRSEEISNGTLVSYSEYDYDPAGNLGAQALYQRNTTTGELFQSRIYVYLYFLNGNIYKQLTYLPTEDPEEPELISTRTYDNYSNAFNPFPMIEIIPGLIAQQHLPGSFRLEEHGVDLLYNLSYEFNAGGLPVKRYTSGNGGSEVTTYEYY